MRPALVLALAALLLSGCGGHKAKPPLSKAQYEQRMTPIAATLAHATTAASAALGGPSLTAAAAAIDQQARELETTTRRLQAISPPKDVRREHGAFTDAVRALAAALRGTAIAARTGDSTSLQATGDFEVPAENARQAAEKITAKGYNVPGLGG
jgi:HPt (histidine-containing phosphotransfer) domain-containing protein